MQRMSYASAYLTLLVSPAGYTYMYHHNILPASALLNIRTNPAALQIQSVVEVMV